MELKICYFENQCQITVDFWTKIGSDDSAGHCMTPAWLSGNETGFGMMRMQIIVIQTTHERFCLEIMDIWLLTQSCYFLCVSVEHFFLGLLLSLFKAIRTAFRSFLAFIAWVYSFQLERRRSILMIRYISPETEKHFKDTWYCVNVNSTRFCLSIKKKHLWRMRELMKFFWERISRYV